MKNNAPAECPQTLSVENEYINSMLDIDCMDIPEPDTIAEIIDHNEAYTKPEIECKIFDIAGIKMALPSSSISTILEQQTILSNASKNSQPAMCAGLINHNDEQIVVIDLAVLIMKGIPGFEKPGTGEGDIIDIALLKGCSAGFICKQSIDTGIVSNEQICWRDKESERIWLAGTAAQMGFSLLDINGVINLLDNND